MTALDASVVVVALDRPGRMAATALASQQTLHAPALSDFEVASVLRRYAHAELLGVPLLTVNRRLATASGVRCDVQVLSA